MKYSAEELSRAGDKYLGTPYSEMDCQAFVEKCMADVGYRRNLPGSNAWYRAMDWTGTPEECKKQYGCIPPGALLFILSHDGGEPAKYKPDGLGNASHMGIVTHRDEGAIHSSSSRGCVAKSKFADKTIPNGGWNQVGLLSEFDYGKSVNWVLDHGQSRPQEKEEMLMQGIVTAMSGSTVNLRIKPAINASLVDRIPIGTGVDILEYGPDWSKVDAGGKIGWMMTQFIKVDAEIVPGEEDQQEPLPDPDGWVQLRVRYEDLSAAYPFIKAVCEQIVEQIGRG